MVSSDLLTGPLPAFFVFFQKSPEGLIIGLDLRFGHPPHAAPAGLPNPAAGLDLPIQAERSVAQTKTIRPADRAFARFFYESKAFFQKSPMVTVAL